MKERIMIFKTNGRECELKTYPDTDKEKYELLKLMTTNHEICRMMASAVITSNNKLAIKEVMDCYNEAVLSTTCLINNTKVIN